MSLADVGTACASLLYLLSDAICAKRARLAQLTQANGPTLLECESPCGLFYHLSA